MSATNIPILTLSIAAAAAIAEFRAVGYNGQTAAAGEAIYGISQTDALVDDQVAIDVLGTTIATAGATVAVGDALEVGADGKLVPQSAGATVGRALTAGGDEAQIEVLLIPA